MARCQGASAAAPKGATRMSIFACARHAWCHHCADPCEGIEAGDMGGVARGEAAADNDRVGDEEVRRASVPATWRRPRPPGPGRRARVPTGARARGAARIRARRPGHLEDHAPGCRRHTGPSARPVSSVVAEPIWGTMITLGACTSGSSGRGGSSCSTSRAAPAIRPASSASVNAPWSTTEPRAVLTRKAVGFIVTL